MAEISWIKLKTTMFDDEKIRLIQAVPESDAILVIWIRLLVLAGKTNDDGLIYIQRNMPYTEEMLATLFGKNVNTVRLALTTLANFNMIDLGTDGLIAISNWEKHQNIEGMDKVREQNRLRKQKQRAKNKLISDVAGPSRDSHATDIDKDKEIDKEKDKEKSQKFSTEHFRLASKLKDNLLSDFPKEMGKVDLNKWADIVRLMEERDDLTIKQIEYVIDWLPLNEFWFGNIRSAAKLREKFETLKHEIKKEAVVKKSGKGYSRPPIREEKLPDWAKGEERELEVSPERQAEIDRKLQEYLNNKAKE